MSALNYSSTLSWVFIMKGDYNNSPRVSMSLNSDTFFWFRVNQYLYLLLTNTRYSEKQHIQIILFFGF